MGFALLEIVEPLGKMPVDERLGRKRYFTVLDARFQEVADLDMHLFANVLGNHDLKFVLDGYDVHGASFIIVQLLNSTTEPSFGQGGTSIRVIMSFITPYYAAP
jgi:hypothetical protein